MKKIIAGAVMASALLAGSPLPWTSLDGQVYAATSVKPVISHYPVNVNGTLTTIRSLHHSGVALFAANDLAKLFSAKCTYDKAHQRYEIRRTSPAIRIVLQAGKNKALVNGKHFSLSIAPQRVGKELYVDAKPIAQLLGGQWQTENGIAIVSTSGSFRSFRETWEFDGSPSVMHGITFHHVSFYSVYDIAAAFDAAVHVDKKTSMVKVTKGKRTILFDPFSYTLNVNGKKMNMPIAPFIQKGVPYADLPSIVRALGGDIDGRFIATAGLIKGMSTHPQWVNPNTLLISRPDDSTSLLLDIRSRRAIRSINQMDLTLSPNGKQAAYVDENGHLFIIDLSSNVVKQIGDDDEVKTDFVWSNDGRSLYCIYGSNNDAIAVVSLETGSINKLIDDKVKYKTDLRLSPDGTKLLYTVANEGKTNYTDDQKTDVDSIDTSGTDPQLFLVDLSSANKQPMPLTSSPDNKVNSAFLSNSEIVYVSAIDSETARPSLKRTRNGNEQTLLANQNIIDAVVVKSRIYVAIETNGIYTIRIFDPSTSSWTTIGSTKNEITSIAPSPYDNQIAVTIATENGEKISILRNGRWIDMTK
ncbi:stalk domain-containing protein [Caldibacillus thermoamylovorans]